MDASGTRRKFSGWIQSLVSCTRQAAGGISIFSLRQMWNFQLQPMSSQVLSSQLKSSKPWFLQKNQETWAVSHIFPLGLSWFWQVYVENWIKHVSFSLAENSKLNTFACVFSCFCAMTKQFQSIRWRISHSKTIFGTSNDPIVIKELPWAVGSVNATFAYN